MRKFLAGVVIAASLGAFSFPVLSSSAQTKRVPVTHIVKMHVWRVRHGKRVRVVIHRREDVRVWRRVKVKRRVKVHGKWKVETRIVRRKVIEYKQPPPATTTTTTSTSQPPTSTSIASASTIAVRASIDPTWTLEVSTPQIPSEPVQFTYSATDAGQTGTVAAGSLTFNVYHHGSNTSVGGCATNVGGSTTGSTCTVSIPSWGQYDLVTSYSGGANIIATEGTETVDIEPPTLAAITNTETWPSATGTIVIASTSSATATVTSSSFEGASAVTLTDQAGDECSATVSGTTASCTWSSLAAAPTSVSIGYPKVSTTTSQTASPWGITQSQSVTDVWPATTASIAPAITKASQTVSFTSSGGTPVTGTTYSPTGSSTSGDAVTFTGSGDCSGTGTITMGSTSGTCTVTANQAGNGYYTAASTTQSFYVHTVTTVTETVSSIQAAASISNPCGTLTNSGAYQCVEMGVVLSTSAPSGTVTLTATATNTTHNNAETASCTVNVASATTCYALFDSETGFPNLGNSGWSIAASYGGTSTTDSNGNVTNYSTASLTATMSMVNSGSWYGYQGS